MHFHGLFQFNTNTFFLMSTDEQKFFSTSFEAGIHRGCNLFLRVKSLPLNIQIGCVVDSSDLAILFWLYPIRVTMLSTFSYYIIFILKVEASGYWKKQDRQHQHMSTCLVRLISLHFIHSLLFYCR